MGPQALAQVLRPLAGMFDAEKFPALIRGLEAPDDAAVWKLDAERAVVLTADFFPPVVDDPYDFGAIAAANALSDLYAMGAQPLMGINLVGWPESLDTAILAEILRGGGEKLREAGAAIAGGHTTTDTEPKYGVAVLGIVHPARLLTKGGARAGDTLYLTKPLGTGVVTTAQKRDRVSAEHLTAAVESMKRLNGGAARALAALDPDVIHAATDITGFGLGGHAHEMAEQSGLALRFDRASLPYLPGAEGYARDGLVPGGGRRNREYYGAWTRLATEMEDWEQTLFFDPQTSGGLFFAVDPRCGDDVEAAFRAAGEPLWRIGEACSGDPGGLSVR